MPAHAEPLAIVAAALGILVGTALAIGLIIAFIRFRRRCIVARGPLTEPSEVELAKPGSYDIHLEGPLRFGGFMVQLPGVRIGGPRLRMVDAATGFEVPLSAPLLPSRSSGFSRGRVHLSCFSIGHAGRYVLSCENWQGPDHADDELLVTVPTGLRSLFYLLGMLAGFFLAMGSVFMLGWLMLG